MAAVWELDLLPQDKFILLAFADYADDSGYCYPSLYRISWKCGVSKDSIRRCLARAVFKGIIVILKKGSGRGHTTLYQLLPEKGSRLHPFISERVAIGRERVANSVIKGSTLSAANHHEPLLKPEPKPQKLQLTPEGQARQEEKARRERESMKARAERESQKKKRWL